MLSNVTAPPHNPIVTIDGLDMRPGEARFDYHDRALAWMASNPGFDPAGRRHSLRRLIGQSTAYAAGLSILLWAYFLV